MTSLLKAFKKKHKEAPKCEDENSIPTTAAAAAGGRDVKSRQSIRSLPDKQRRRTIGDDAKPGSQAFSQAKAAFDDLGGVYVGSSAAASAATAAHNSSFGSSSAVSATSNNNANAHLFGKLPKTQIQTIDQQQQQQQWLRPSAPYHLGSDAPATRRGPRSLDLNLTRQSKRTSSTRETARHRHKDKLSPDEEGQWSDVASDVGFRGHGGGGGQQRRRSERHSHRDRRRRDWDRELDYEDTMSDVNHRTCKPMRNIRREYEFYAPGPSQNEMIPEESVSPPLYPIKTSHSDYHTSERQQQQHGSHRSSSHRKSYASPSKRDQQLMPPPPPPRWADVSSRRASQDTTATSIRKLDSSPVNRRDQSSGGGGSSGAEMSHSSSLAGSPVPAHNDRTLIKRLRQQLTTERHARAEVESREQAMLNALHDTLAGMCGITGGSSERTTDVPTLSIRLKEQLAALRQRNEEMLKLKAQLEIRQDEYKQMENEWNAALAKAAEHVKMVQQNCRNAIAQRDKLQQRVSHLEFECKLSKAQLARALKKIQSPDRSSGQQQQHEMMPPPRMTRRYQNNEDLMMDSIMSMASHKFTGPDDSYEVQLCSGEALCSRPNSFTNPSHPPSLLPPVQEQRTPRVSTAKRTPMISTPLSSRQQQRQQQQHAQHHFNQTNDSDLEMDEVRNYATADFDSGTGTALSTVMSSAAGGCVESVDSCSSKSASSSVASKLKLLEEIQSCVRDAHHYKENAPPPMHHDLSSISELSVEKPRCSASSQGGALVSGSSIASSAFVASLIGESKARQHDCSSTPKSSPPAKRAANDANAVEDNGSNDFMPASSVTVQYVTSVVTTSAEGRRLLEATTTNEVTVLSASANQHRASGSPNSQDDDGYATLNSDTQQCASLASQQQQQSVTTFCTYLHRALSGSQSASSFVSSNNQPLMTRSSSSDDLLATYWRRHDRLLAPIARCPVDGSTISATLLNTMQRRRSLSESCVSGGSAWRQRSHVSRMFYLLMCARARHAWPVVSRRHNAADTTANRSMSAADLTQYAKSMLHFSDSHTQTSLAPTGSRIATSTSGTTSCSEPGNPTNEALYDLVPVELSRVPLNGEEPELLNETSDDQDSNSPPLQDRHRERARRCATPKMFQARLFRRLRSLTSEDSEDDGRTTMEVWNRQLKTKAHYDKRRAVVRYSPPRASILPGNVWHHFGERERKAIALFDFLNEHATDVSSGGVTSPESWPRHGGGMSSSRRRRRPLSRSCSSLGLSDSQLHSSQTDSKLYENLPYQSRSATKCPSTRSSRQQRRQPPAGYRVRPMSRHSSLDSIRSDGSSLVLNDLLDGKDGKPPADCTIDTDDHSFSSSSSISYRAGSR